MDATEFRALRLRLGITQGEAAALLHCAERTVRQWEAGERTAPRLVVKVLQMIEAGLIRPGDLRSQRQVEDD